MAGLVLCGQRWYAPGYACWLSRDPAGYGGGANLYAYCGDNPVGLVDAKDPPNAGGSFCVTLLQVSYGEVDVPPVDEPFAGVVVLPVWPESGAVDVFGDWLDPFGDDADDGVDVGVELSRVTPPGVLSDEDDKPELDGTGAAG